MRFRRFMVPPWTRSRRRGAKDSPAHRRCPARAAVRYFPMRATNMLVLMSDEHNPKFLGAAGHSFIATPNLDALAARGTRFTAAYTTCPICVPARAAFAVGRYVHDIGYWDNADGYEGAIPSWHHALRDAGHRVVSIGKLHFRGRPGDDHGFSEEIVPMHIVDGIGDVKGLVRENIPKRKGGDKMAQARRPRRVRLHRVRPRHRGARADLAARGGAEVA